MRANSARLGELWTRKQDELPADFLLQVYLCFLLLTGFDDFLLESVDLQHEVWESID